MAYALTIGEAARTSGVATRTIRYYEEIGVSPTARRTASGYRLYDRPGVERLEVDRDQVADVVGEERPPGPRGVGAVLRHEARDGAFDKGDAELQELAVDARRSPQGIRGPWTGVAAHARGDGHEWRSTDGSRSG
jgi:hypothetical protein